MFDPFVVMMCAFASVTATAATMEFHRQGCTGWRTVAETASFAVAMLGLIVAFLSMVWVVGSAIIPVAVILVMISCRTMQRAHDY